MAGTDRLLFNMAGALSWVAMSTALVLIASRAVAQGISPSVAAKLASGDATGVWAVYLLAGILTVGLAGLGVFAREMFKRFDRYEMNIRRSIIANATVNTRTQTMVVLSHLTASTDASTGEMSKQAQIFMDRVEVEMEEQRRELQRLVKDYQDG